MASDDGPDFEFITDEELGVLRDADKTAKIEPDPYGDPAEHAPNRPGQNRNLTETQSKALVVHSERASNRQAADDLGVSRTTVERHRAFWLDQDRHDAFTLAGLTGVSDRLCGAMRCACHNGDTVYEVAARWDVSIGTVSNHVSAERPDGCSHTPAVEVPRVDFDHGGMRGDEDDRVCPNCGFVSSMQDHECRN